MRQVALQLFWGPDGCPADDDPLTPNYCFKEDKYLSLLGGEDIRFTATQDAAYWAERRTGQSRWAAAEHCLERLIRDKQAPPIPDTDGDGVCDIVDNCPVEANGPYPQPNCDGDDFGDECDDDSDNDGAPDEWELANIGPASAECDFFDGDFDNDGIKDGEEMQFFDRNNNTVVEVATIDTVVAAVANDTDGDGILDGDEDEDLNNDGTLDRLDADIDDDGILDGADNCKADANPAQLDLNDDGEGDVCDSDDDGDGRNDDMDNCPVDDNRFQEDEDADGFGDVCDECPAEANEDDHTKPCPRDYEDDGSSCLTSGSVVSVEAQVLGESIPIIGTGLTLIYSSNRVPGFKPRGAKSRDLRALGLGGWTLSGHQSWESYCPGVQDNCPEAERKTRLLLGSGGILPFIATYSINGLTGVPSGDDSVAYLFDANQRHVETLNSLTGRLIARFEYDASNRIQRVENADGLIATIAYAGNSIVFTSRDGVNITVDKNGSGYIGSTTLPGGKVYVLTYDTTAGSEGLLTRMVLPTPDGAWAVATKRFRYDAQGLLLGDTDMDTDAYNNQSPPGENDWENLLLDRSAGVGYFQVTRSRLVQVDEGIERRIDVVHKVNDDGSREFTSLGQTTRVEPIVDCLAEADCGYLQGFEMGLRTVEPDGAIYEAFSTPGDRWTGEASSSRSLVTPPTESLEPMVLETAKTIVLGPGPLGPLSVTHIQATARRGGVLRTTVDTYPSGDGVRYGGEPFVEMTSAEGYLSATIGELDQPTEIRVGDLHPVRYTYDDRGRVLTVSQGVGVDERVTAIAYDDVTRTTTTTAPDGSQTIVTQDAAYRVAEIETVGSQEPPISFSYDPGDNLTSLTPPGKPVHTWGYSLGGKLEQYEPPAVDGVASTSTYTSAFDGRPLTATDPSGELVTVVYDSVTGAPNLVEVKAAVGGAVTTRLTMVYDAANQHRLQSATFEPLLSNPLVDQERPPVVQTPTYDGSMRTGHSTTIQWSTGDRQFHTSVATDPVSWLTTSVQIASGQNGQGGQWTLPVAFDLQGSPLQIGDLSIERGAKGLPLPVRATVGATRLDFDYDLFGETVLRSYSLSTAPESSLFSQEYTRNVLGQLVGVNEFVSAAAGGVVNRTWSYSYDLSGRLTSASADGETYAYTYSTNGARLSRTVDGVAEAGAVVDTQDRLIAFNGTTYEYDANGRLESMSGLRGDWTYEYDGSGSLLSVSNDGAMVVEYLVDGSGRRIGRRLAGGAFTYWMYKDGLNPIAELDESFRLRKVFVYGTNGHVPEYMVILDAQGAEEGTYRFVVDQVGSVRGVIDAATGDWTERTDYSPFGVPTTVLAAAGDLTQPFGYAGGLTDSVTGLVRFGARDYDPLLGRWTAKDPIRFAAGDTNLYAYVGSSPVGSFDPSGLICGGCTSNAVSSGTTFQTLAFNDSAALVSVLSFIGEEVAWTVATGGALTVGKWLYRGARWGYRAARGIRWGKKIETADDARQAASTARAACWGDEISDGARMVDQPLAPKGPGRLRPTQDAVSGPQVDRLAADMAENGFNRKFPVIVDGDLVVNGHHRVVAAKKAGVEVVTTPGTVSNASKANALKSFDDIKVDPVDWYD